jgi:hypothetical protein
MAEYLTPNGITRFTKFYDSISCFQEDRNNFLIPLSTDHEMQKHYFLIGKSLYATSAS